MAGMGSGSQPSSRRVSFLAIHIHRECIFPMDGFAVNCSGSISCHACGAGHPILRLGLFLYDSDGTPYKTILDE